MKTNFWKQWKGQSSQTHLNYFKQFEGQIGCVNLHIVGWFFHAFFF